MWKQKYPPPFLDSNQNLEDALMVYSKKTMVYPNFLEVMFHYLHDNIISNLLKLMNSHIFTRNKDLALLLEDEERAKAKNTHPARKK